MSNAYELILEEWIASLKDKDRSKKYVESNFEELFESLKKANASFEEARDILPRAVKAHLPNPGLVRATYRALKNSGKTLATEKEFEESWSRGITDDGTSALYTVFGRPKLKDEDDDGEPKVYGNMSAKEYKMQRRYVEQFPVLNTAELEKRMLSSVYDPVNDIGNILGKGESDDDSK